MGGTARVPMITCLVGKTPRLIVKTTDQLLPVGTFELRK